MDPSLLSLGVSDIHRPASVLRGIGFAFFDKGSKLPGVEQTQASVEFRFSGSTVGSGASEEHAPHQNEEFPTSLLMLGVGAGACPLVRSQNLLQDDTVHVAKAPTEEVRHRLRAWNPVPQFMHQVHVVELSP